MGVQIFVVENLTNYESICAATFRPRPSIGHRNNILPPPRGMKSTCSNETFFILEFEEILISNCKSTFFAGQCNWLTSYFPVIYPQGGINQCPCFCDNQWFRDNMSHIFLLILHCFLIHSYSMAMKYVTLTILRTPFTEDFRFINYPSFPNHVKNSLKQP